MSRLSRGQKARLGIFLAAAALLLAATVLTMLGVALFQARDEFKAVFEGSVSGLEPGAPVKYNGVRVGRVDEVTVAKDRFGAAEVRLSLEPGLPLRTDTVATVNMQGITGLKYVELSGGTSEAPPLPPGGELKTEASALDKLTGQAGDIADRIQDLIDNLVRLTGAENVDRVGETLEEVRSITRNLREVVEESRPDIRAVIANARVITEQLTTLSIETSELVHHVREVVQRGVDPEQVARIMDRIEASARSLEQRLSSQELGVAVMRTGELIADSQVLIRNLNISVLRIKEDFVRVLSTLETGVENFADFAAVLRDNPAALIRGRQLEQRELP